MPTRDEAAGQLQRSLFTFTRALGIRLFGDADVYLIDQIQAATRRMEAEGALDDASVQRAEESLFQWVYFAATGERRIPSREPWRLPPRRTPGDVDGDDLRQALIKLCPGFWPFC